MPLNLTAWENWGSGLGALSVKTASILLILYCVEKAWMGVGLFYYEQDDKAAGQESQERCLLLFIPGRSRLCDRGRLACRTGDMTYVMSSNSS